MVTRSPELGMVSSTLNPCSAKFGCHRCCGNVDRSFLIFHVTTLSNDLMTWLVGPTNLKLILCQIWGLQVLWKDSYDIFHLSRDYVIKKSFDFEGGYYSAKFGGHRYCGRADIRLFIYFSFKSIQNKDQISISKFIFR